MLDKKIPAVSRGGGFDLSALILSLNLCLEVVGMLIPTIPLLKWAWWHLNKFSLTVDTGASSSKKHDFALNKMQFMMVNQEIEADKLPSHYTH